MRWRCNNPACGRFPRGFTFEGDARGGCPKCGATAGDALSASAVLTSVLPGGKPLPLLTRLVDVHLMVMNPRGPILSQSGRQYVACQPKREHLARHAEDRFAATGEAAAVTCPSCLRTKEFALAAVLQELEELASLTAPVTATTVDLGAYEPSAPAKKS